MLNVVQLSPEERIYIIHGVEDDVREDGRSGMQFRSVEIETEVIPSAMGSSRITIGSTDVVACVKANTFEPDWNRPNEGKLKVHVDISATASPRFEGRRGEQKSEEISTILNKAYESIHLESLCIVPKVKSWILDVDVSVLSYGGNVFDAISFAIKAALATSAIPKMRSSEEDEGERDLQIPDDPFDTWTPDVSNIPCLVTLSKIGTGIVVDATLSEELCSSFTCILAVTEQGRILSTLKTGPGSVQPSTFVKLISRASAVGCKVNKLLLNAIEKERKLKSSRRQIDTFFLN